MVSLYRQLKGEDKIHHFSYRQGNNDSKERKLEVKAQTIQQEGGESEK